MSSVYTIVVENATSSFTLKTEHLNVGELKDVVRALRDAGFNAGLQQGLKTLLVKDKFAFDAMDAREHYRAQRNMVARYCDQHPNEIEELAEMMHEERVAYVMQHAFKRDEG